MATTRHIILVGMMGVGKSSLGRKLARRLNLPLADSDFEIERASGMGIRDLFARYGEEELRALERRVLHRLLDSTPHVIATGGDAFADDETRHMLKERGTTIWLRANIDTLTARIRRLDHRPLLEEGEIRPRLEELLAVREPLYAEAELTLVTDNQPVSALIERAVVLLGYKEGPADSSAGPSND